MDECNELAHAQSSHLVGALALPFIANAVSFANKAVGVIFFKYSKRYYSLYSLIELEHAVSQGAQNDQRHETAENHDDRRFVDVHPATRG